MSGHIIGVVVTALNVSLFVFKLGPCQVFDEGFVTVLIVVIVYFLTVDGHSD